MAKSIIILDIEPSECELCNAWLRNAAVCTWTMRFGNDECPLKKIGLIEQKIRPLSKEKFTKIYIEGFVEEE